MKNEVIVFNNEEFGEIRTTSINGEPWFIGKDVARTLGYKNTKDALSKHVDEDDKIMGSQNTTPSIIDSMGRIQYPTWINESGVYALIFGSKLPSAKKFKHWVTSEVLPQIRKTGMYHMPQTTDEKISLLAQGHSEVIQRLESQQKEIDTIKERLNIIGFADNEWMLKKLQSATKAKVLRLTENPTYRVLWSRYFFGGIYKSVKDHFRVASLKSIPANSLESALEIINDWYPTDIFLQNRIISMKAHQEKNLLPDKKVIALLQYLKDTQDGEINPFNQTN